MKSSGDKPTSLVADANVLIDYAKSDKSVILLISRYLATVCIPTPVFDEIHELSKREAKSLKITLIEPTLSQAQEALVDEGPLSFQDRLCFIVARDKGWSVLTNDKNLRKTCESEDLDCVWGIEAMVPLVHNKCLSASKAMKIAKKIESVNPCITEDILKRFGKKIGL